MGLLIGIVGFDLLYILAARPFREHIENYVYVVIDSMQITVLSLLFVAGLHPKASNVEQIALAASIIQILAIALIVSNQLRAERAMFKMFGTRVKLVCRALYRRAILKTRGHGRTHWPEGGGAALGDGAARRARADVGLQLQPKLAHILFAPGDEEKKLQEAAKLSAMQRKGADMSTAHSQAIAAPAPASLAVPSPTAAPAPAAPAGARRGARDRGNSPSAITVTL
eukprot:tig00020952_g16474.t1